MFCQLSLLVTPSLTIYKLNNSSNVSVKNIPGLKIWDFEGSFLSKTTVTFSLSSKFNQGKIMVDFA